MKEIQIKHLKLIREGAQTFTLSSRKNVLYCIADFKIKILHQSF